MSATGQAENRCFICGPANPEGLQLTFRREGDRAVADVSTPAHMCGWDGVTHGGIVYSLLDDAMANWLMFAGDRGFTARCEVRYRGQTPVETPLRLEGWETSRRGRLAMTSARLVNAESGEVLAEADARFMLEPRA